MELQEALPDFDAAGVRVYALSYDEPEALRDFQEAHQITYTLLSDRDSEVIREYGILNTLIAEDDHPWFGIPFPGAYVTDAHGRVTHKFFENNLALRVGPERLLRAVQGRESHPEVQADATIGSSGIDRRNITPEVFLDGGLLALGLLRDLVARFEVPPGRHLYASPAASGMIAAKLNLDPHAAVVAKDLEVPTSMTHSITATGESFQVHKGTVELRIPLTANRLWRSDSGAREVTLTGSIEWQCCDDEVCDVPRREPFELTIPVTGWLQSDLSPGPEISETRRENAIKHFQKMSSRRLG